MKQITTAFMLFLFFLFNLSTAQMKFFQQAAGKTLNYKTIKINKQAENPAVKKIKSGQKVRYLRSIPLALEVTFSGMKEYKGKQCYALNLKSTLKNPLHGAVPDQTENMEEFTKAYVSQEGQIIYVNKITKAGGNTNYNKNLNLPFKSTLDYFYGQWMLKLKKDYSYKDQSKGKYTEIKVLKIKENNKGKYFVVHYLSKTDNKTDRDLIYWIDVSKRIALRVKNNQHEMRLIK